MRIFYMFAAHNEVEALPDLVATMKAELHRLPQLQVYVLNNGSDDGSNVLLKKLSAENPWLHGVTMEEKGMGVAYRHGMNLLKTLGLTKEDWILFTAADLPFGFSDYDAFTEFKQRHPDCGIFVGSKSHSRSVVVRSLKRSVGSWVFQMVRQIILGMRTKDPQGTLFLRGDYLNLVDKIQSPDYFFGTELVYLMEKYSQAVEMPITLNPERRLSKVNLVRDGIKVIKQTFALRLREAKKR
jgi:dolichyl-phosphate beta-glucosyltransferase